MAKKREIRNSTAEFLIFQAENKEQGIEVMYADETIWCTQKAMAALFDVGVPAISKHLANVFETGELKEEATISKMETVQQEGHREVKRTVVMYKLDAIIAVGYRVNSIRATQFRQWATSVLRQFAIRGYVLDKKRMENGTFLLSLLTSHLSLLTFHYVPGVSESQSGCLPLFWPAASRVVSGFLLWKEDACRRVL